MPLSNKQRRLLFATYRELNIDDTTRHLLQHEITGKASLKKMGNIDFEKLVRHLRERGARIDIDVQPHPGQPALHPAGGDDSKIRLITKLYAVWAPLAGTYYEPRYQRRALRAFLRKRVGPSHENFCSVKQLIGAIEAIKAIGKRKSVIWD